MSSDQSSFKEAFLDYDYKKVHLPILSAIADWGEDINVIERQIIYYIFPSAYYIGYLSLF